MRTLDAWYDHIDIERVMDLVRTETSESLVVSYRRSLSDWHHPIEEFDHVHTARKVVGVGNVGTRAWIHLFVGRDDQDPLLLQSKEAQASVLERFVGESEHTTNGRRVVVGQRLMQAASDIFLGWLRVEGLDGQMRDYYVCKLHDWKGRRRGRGHAGAGSDALRTAVRSDSRPRPCPLGRQDRDRLILGKGDAFDRAIADFAAAYADQNERDYEAFAEAVASGRLEAEPGL